MSRIDEMFPTGLELPYYQAGFGDIRTNLWLGLDRIYQLTNPRVNEGLIYRLRMEMQSNEDNRFIPHNIKTQPTGSLHIIYEWILAYQTKNTATLIARFFSKNLTSATIFAIIDKYDVSEFVR